MIILEQFHKIRKIPEVAQPQHSWSSTSVASWNFICTWLISADLGPEDSNWQQFHPWALESNKFRFKLLVLVVTV